MEKKTVKAVTRKQKYLAAIAGDGVAPNPITSDEKLMYNIAEKVNEGGGSGGDNNTEIVNFTITYDSENDSYGATCDHTFAQLDSARIAGKDIIPIINVPAEITLGSDMMYVADLTYNDDGREKSYIADYYSIRSGLGGLFYNLIRCTIYSDDDTIAVDVVMGDDVSVGAALYVKEESNKLDKTYVDISSALQIGGKVVYVFRKVGMFDKRILGVILSAEYDDTVPTYDVYGMMLSSGSFSTVHWKATTGTGTLTRV